MPAPRKDIIALHAKLERAEKHIYDLQEFWQRFSTPKNYPVKGECDRHVDKYVFRLLSAPPIPVDIPLLAGDAIHNISSALDHATYRLACVGTKSSGPFDNVYFPTGKSPRNFKARIRSIKKLLRSDAIKALTEIEAYPGGREELFWQFHELNNIDKHRLLLTLSTQNRLHSMSPHEVTYLRRKFLGMRGVTERNDYRLFLTTSEPLVDLKAGDILAILSKSEMQKKMHFPIELAFGEPPMVKGKPVIPLLWDMFMYVQHLIMQFDSVGLFD